MVILGPLLLVMYLAAVLLIGGRMLRSFIGFADSSELRVPAALMVGFFVSFLVFILTSLVAPGLAIYVSIAVPIAAGVVFYLADRQNLQSALPTTWRRWVLTIGIAWMLLLTQYAVECWTLLESTARGEGVIYQDIIYHGGIARSLALYGFPAQNLQFAGEYIGYHIFSHFVAIQLATILTIPVYVVYVYVITPLFFLLICMASYAFISAISGSERFNVLVRVGIIYGSLLSMFMLSGLPRIATPLYLSHSFQLQITSILIVLSYLYLIHDDRIELSRKVILLISILFAESILIKGSSLPILMAAIGSWMVFDMVGRKKADNLHIASVLMLVLVSGIIYLVFFYFPGYSIESSPFTLHVDRLYELDLVREVSELAGAHGLLIAVASAASIISYRFLLLVRPIDAYSGALLVAFASGVVMYLTIQYGANYYLLAIVSVTNMFCLTWLACEWSRVTWMVRITSVAAVLLSLYPVHGGGYAFTQIMLDRKADTYYPLTPEKRQLYDELASVSDRQSLIFTTAVLAAPSRVKDYYYPAALSGRQFYLGGHRLRVHALPGLEDRRNFQRAFSPMSPDDLRHLEDLGVDFVLIETADLAPAERDAMHEAVESTSLYDTVFRNDAGVILSPRPDSL